MRLINADKFEVVTAQYDMPQSETVSVIIEPAYEVQKRKEMCADAFISGMDYVLNKIDEAPTVKAIPIEWIKRYGKKQANKCCHCATAIWEMLEDWEKENEI